MLLLYSILHWSDGGFAMPIRFWANARRCQAAHSHIGKASRIVRSPSGAIGRTRANRSAAQHAASKACCIA